VGDVPHPNHRKHGNRISRTLSTALLLATAIPFAVADAQDTLRVSGLSQPVEIIKDRWGIQDLFFAQGFSAARDRLFQFEVWRRQTNGTVAEVLGRRELTRDIGTRLFKFRGDLTQELNHYHQRGEQIITAFVRGVNAYIEETERNPELLPIEFELLGIRPGKWTPEVVISRHQGLLGNIGQEMNYGRAVAAVGAEKVRELSYFHPGDPDITLDEAIDGSLLFDDILGLISWRRTDPAAMTKHALPEAPRSGTRSST
jgi:penicillin amidase